MSGRISLKRFPARCRASILSEVSTLIPFDPSNIEEGLEDPKRESVLMGTAGFILATEFCERLAYFGKILLCSYEYSEMVLEWFTHFGLSKHCV